MTASQRRRTGTEACPTADSLKAVLLYDKRRAEQEWDRHHPVIFLARWPPRSAAWFVGLPKFGGWHLFFFC
jgi:hypothetical protein